MREPRSARAARTGRRRATRPWPPRRSLHRPLGRRRSCRTRRSRRHEASPRPSSEAAEDRPAGAAPCRTSPPTRGERQPIHTVRRRRVPLRHRAPVRRHHRAAPRVERPRRRPGQPRPADPRRRRAARPAPGARAPAPRQTVHTRPGRRQPDTDRAAATASRCATAAVERSADDDDPRRPAPPSRSEPRAADAARRFSAGP